MTKEIKIQFYNGDVMILKHVSDFTLINSNLQIVRNKYVEEFRKVQFIEYVKIEME